MEGAFKNTRRLHIPIDNFNLKKYRLWLIATYNYYFIKLYFIIV